MAYRYYEQYTLTREKEEEEEEEEEGVINASR